MCIENHRGFYLFEDVIFDILISKLKKIKEGKIQKDNFSTALEKVQFDLLSSAFDIEEYILRNPSFEIQESEITMYGLAFEDNFSPTILEYSDFETGK
jgi:hypothetical protein